LTQNGRSLLWTNVRHIYESSHIIFTQKGAESKLLLNLHTNFGIFESLCTC
jgi:hypothetical protein